jgi:hypothetical protein
MKTVLLITREEIHQKIYEPALKKNFTVVCASSTHGAPREVAAVIYDLPKYPPAADFRWLEELGLPVVVLTPMKRLGVPKARLQRVLEYMVRTDQILKALSELGVCTGEKC